MPNWCWNRVEIMGRTNRISAFARDLEDLAVKADSLESHDGLLSYLCPLEGVTSDNWYEKQRDAWGTKWDVQLKDVYMATKEFDDDPAGHLYLIFDSAWSPPFGALLSFSESNPDVAVSISYREDGMAFGGFAMFKDGWFVNEDVDFADVDFGESCPGDDEWDAAEEEINAMLDGAMFVAVERFERELELRGEAAVMRMNGEM